MLRFTIGLPVLAAGILISVAAADPAAKPAANPPANITFAKDIQPVLLAKCSNCHGNIKKGGLDVRTLESLKKGGNSGPAFKPGNLKDSPLWYIIGMGPFHTLTDVEKNLIKQWIQAAGRPWFVPAGWGP